jgi:hypothetical protein
MSRPRLAPTRGAPEARGALAAWVCAAALSVAGAAHADGLRPADAPRAQTGAGQVARETASKVVEPPALPS